MRPWIRQLHLLDEDAHESYRNQNYNQMIPMQNRLDADDLQSLGLLYQKVNRLWMLVMFRVPLHQILQTKKHRRAVRQQHQPHQRRKEMSLEAQKHRRVKQQVQNNPQMFQELLPQQNAKKKHYGRS